MFQGLPRGSRNLGVDFLNVACVDNSQSCEYSMFMAYTVKPWLITERMPVFEKKVPVAHSHPETGIYKRRPSVAK